MARWEETREEVWGQLTYLKMMVLGSLSLGKTLVTNAGDVRRLRQAGASEERYVRPIRRYELPPYREGMEVCRSREKYLRPTHFGAILLLHPYETKTKELEEIEIRR